MNILRNNATLQDTWFSKGGQAVMGSVWGLTQDIRDYFSLREKNDSLANENFHLMTRIRVLESYMEDSLRISRIGGNNIVDDYRFTPATISKISNNSQHNYIIINKGSGDGVSKGSGLITGKGAVGIIDGVSENYAYARSFKNIGMSISARLGRNGASGPLVWDGIHSNGAILKEIPHHLSISQGDTVFTSGFSSIFPADIPLGTTGEYRLVNGSTFEIDVRLFEDYNALRYVTVVEHLGKDEIKELEDMQ